MNDIIPAFKAAVIENEDLWVFDNNLQAICKINVNTCKMEVIALYQGLTEFIAFWIFSYHDYLLVVTNNSTNMLKFDKRSCKLYEVENAAESSLGKGTVYAFFEQDYIWFIPQYAGRKISCYDLKKAEYRNADDVFSSFVQQYVSEGLVVEFPCVYHNVLWTIVREKAILVKYHLKEHRMEIVKHESFDTLMNAVCFDGEKVWISKYEQGEILCIEQGNIKSIIVEGEQSFSFLYNIKDYIMALPRGGDCVTLIDKETFEVHVLELELSEEEKKREGMGSKILNYAEMGEKIFLMPNAINSLFVLNKKEMEIEKIHLVCDNYNCWGLLKRMQKENILAENDNEKLQDFITCFKRKEFGGKEKIKTIENVGEKIAYTFVR